MLCANGDCSNELSEWELKRLGSHAFRSKKRFCAGCRKHKLPTLQRIRCCKCEESFAKGSSIFQSVCNNCNVEVQRRKEILLA